MFTKYQALPVCHWVFFGSRDVNRKSNDCSEVSNSSMLTVTYSSPRHRVVIHPLTNKKWHHLWAKSRTLVSVICQRRAPKD